MGEGVLMARPRVDTWVDCFGDCGVSLPCRCKQANRLCLVHGKYGSLCAGCFSNLVADVVMKEGVIC